MSLIIAYAVIGLVVGYFFGRSVWRDGATDIRPHSLPWSLTGWVTIGALWPLVSVFVLIWMVGDWLSDHGSDAAKRIGFKIFGK